MIYIVEQLAEYLRQELNQYRASGDDEFNIIVSDFDAEPKTRNIQIRYTGNYEQRRSPKFATRQDSVDLPSPETEKFKIGFKYQMILEDKGDSGYTYYNGLMETQLKIATMLNKSFTFETVSDFSRPS